MFHLLEIQTKTSISPEQLDPSKDANELLLKRLRDKLEGRILKDIGLVVAVNSCNIMGEGEIPLRSPEVLFNASIKLLSFLPEEDEVTEGEVVNVTETGVFVNIGSIDAFWPRSRISDKRLTFNARKGTLENQKGKPVVKRKEKVRVKVNNIEIRTPVSLSSFLKGSIPTPVRSSGGQHQIRIQLEGRGGGIGFIKELQKKRKEILSKIGV